MGRSNDKEVQWSKRTFELVMKRSVTTALSSRDCSSVLRGDEERSLAFSIAVMAAAHPPQHHYAIDSNNITSGQSNLT